MLGQFLVMLREGMESVIFLIPFLSNEPFNTLLGASLGTFVAFILAYLVFSLGLRINLRNFFYFTGIFLVLLAGGLIGYGTHEIIEYLKYSGIQLGWLAKDAYALPIAPDNLLHHKNVVGSILATMFGYSVRAEWARMISHLSYLTIALYATRKIYRR